MRNVRAQFKPLRTLEQIRRPLVRAALCSGAVLCAGDWVSGIVVNATWIGPSGGSWTHAANWSNGAVPINQQPVGTDYNVHIDGAAGGVTVVGNLSLTINNLVVDADDTLRLGNFILFAIQGDDGSATTGSVINNGTISLNTTTNFCQFRTTLGTLTLGGSGVMILNNQNFDRIQGTSTTDYIINGANHTIRGTGRYGNGLTGIINQGLVDADRTTSLTIQPTSSLTATNLGIFRGSNSGGLVLLDGTFDNSAGIIEATAGGLVTIRNSTVIGGTFNTAPTGSIQFSGANILDGATLGNVTINSNVNILDQASVVAVGTIVNNGDVSLLSTANTAELRVGSASLTLSGTGTLRMNSETGDLVLGSAATNLLTNGANHSIRGTGQLGADSLALTNNGLIDADQTAPLVIDPTDSETVINTGTLRGSNSGGLVLLDGTFDNSAGIIEATAGGLVTIRNSTVIGGTFNTAPTGSIQFSGANILDGATLGNVTINSNVNILDQASVVAVGTIVNNGDVSLLSTANTAELRVGSASLTLSGTGTLRMNSETGDLVLGSAATNLLTNGANHSIRGTGQLGADSLALTNNGLIDADQTAPLVIDPTDSETVINTGTLRGSNSGGLVLLDGTFDNGGGGLIEATAGGLVTVQGSTIRGGSLSSAPTGEIQFSGSNELDGATSGAITSTANLRVLSGASVLGAGNIINNGSAQIDAGGGVSILAGAVLSGNGVNSDGNFSVSGTANIADVTGTGLASVQAGGTIITDVARISNLSIDSGGLLRINAGGGTAGTSNVKSLAITGGQLNLTDHDMVIDYDPGPSPITTVRGLLETGYAGGTWSGPGIMTSNGTSNGFAIGYAEATSIFTVFPAIFSGQTVDNSSVLLKFTRFGDSNLSGNVNLDDFNQLASNFGQSNKLWFDADFNYDGVVNLDDFNLLAANFGLSASPGGPTPDDWAALASVVPEPTMLPAGMLGAAALVRRRRRAQRD